jgi:L-amino acid N-acyltransferase YncA
VADYPVYAGLFPELAVPDPVLTAADFGARMVPSMVVLDGEERGIGYAYWQAYGATTHVVHVVVDSRARGRGAGAALLAEVRRRAVAARSTRWYLNLKQDNAAAVRLYERTGFAVEQEGWALRTRWQDLAALAGGADGVSAETSDPADDTGVGARFDLAAERIAQLRARPGEVLVSLRRGGAVVAFAGFAPGFSGVFPVRVSSPDLARPLFDALRPHATRDDLHVFVEGDRVLHDALRACGATLEHATYRMSADLL